MFKIAIQKFIKVVSEPVSIDFATTSSESALPISLGNLGKSGVPRIIVSFVLSTCYILNLTGTTLYLSLVIFLVTVSSFRLQVWPVLAILGIDELMDMARTSVNVIGNTLASWVIARWKGQFDTAKA